MGKRIWAQVENEINQEAIRILESGTIKIEHKGLQVIVSRAKCQILSSPNRISMKESLLSDIEIEFQPLGSV